MKYPLRGYIFLVGTAFFTALSYVFGKAVNKDLNPETVIFFWFFGAFFFSIFAVMLIPSQRTELRYLRNYVTIFVLSSIVTAIGAALWIFSLRTIGPPLTSFLMKSQTLFSLLLGIMFLGERLNKGETIGIMLTIAGGLIVANLRALGVAIVVFVYLIITERFQAPGLRDLVFMAFGGLTGAYIAKASQFQSIKLLDVSHSTAVMPLESLFVVLFSYFIFQDLPSVIKLIGGAGIIIGVVFLVIFRGERADLEVSED